MVHEKQSTWTYGIAVYLHSETNQNLIFLAELSKWSVSFHKIQSRIKNSPFNKTFYRQWSNKHLWAKNDVTLIL